MVLVRSFAKLFSSPQGILLESDPAIAVGVAHLKLRFGVTLLRGHREPFHRFHFVFLAATFAHKEKAKFALSFSVPLLGRLSVPEFS